MVFGFGEKNTLSFALGGYKFKADDNYITYKSAYGKSFRVVKSDIESVSLDLKSAGKCIVKLVGKGTILAEVELPKNWAEKAQDFILSEIKKN